MCEHALGFFMIIFFSSFSYAFHPFQGFHKTRV